MGAFVKPLPPPQGKSLVEGQPIGKIVKALKEIREKAVADVACNVAGLTAQILNNTLVIDGNIPAATSTPTPQEPKYPEDGEGDPGGSIYKGETGGTGGGGGFTGDLSFVQSASIGIQAGGDSLEVSLTYVPVIMRFVNGILQGHETGASVTLLDSVGGTTCECPEPEA